MHQRAQEYTGFAQSRVVAGLNWSAFRSTLNTTSDTEVTFNRYESNKNVLMNAIFELNTYHTHHALWQAATDDPLSTVYSVAWTLCSSLGPPQSLLENPREKLEKNSAVEHYYGTWFAFGLLHKYVDHLWRRALPSQMSARQMAQLFTLEQLLHADVEYVNSFEEVRELRMRNRGEEVRELFRRYERDYLASPLFLSSMEKTPFGAVQRADEGTAEDYEIRFQYVPLYDLKDRNRLSNSFRRIECFEALRVQCERNLQTAFPTYNSTRSGRKLQVNNWLLALLNSNDNDIAFATESFDENNVPDYLLYWQYQKSGLVWFLVHTLFALNDLARNDDLNADLLFFVSEHLHRLVECGVCEAHWKEHGQPAWRTYSAWYEATRTNWEKEAKQYKNESFYNYNSTLGNPGTQPDLYMLRTHNTIQANNINGKKRLSDTCLHAIRIDYLQLAMAVEASVVPSEHSSEVDDRLRTVYRNERTDVLTEGDQVFTEKILMQLAKDIGPLPSLEEVRRNQFAAERRRLYNVMHGLPF